MKSHWNPLKGLASLFRSNHSTGAEKTRHEVFVDEPPPAHLKPPQATRVEPEQLHEPALGGVEAAEFRADPFDMLLADPFEPDPAWTEAEAHTLLLGSLTNVAPPEARKGTGRTEQPSLFTPTSALFSPKDVQSITPPELPADLKGPEPLTLQLPLEPAPPKRVRVYLNSETKQAADPAPLNPEPSLVEPKDSFDLLTVFGDFPLPEGRFTTGEIGSDDLTFHLPLLPSEPVVPVRGTRERQSPRNRAEILAADLIVRHRLDIEELGELANILELAQHTLTVQAIERLFQRGATVEEVSLCFDLRCLWAQQPHYRTYFGYSRASRGRYQGLSYQTLSWGLALNLIQGFHGLPELEELHGALEDHFHSWCEQPPYVYDSFVAYLCAITEGYVGGLDGLHFGTRYDYC